jgi:glucose-1-phosphate cytidylyltransferase
MRIREGNESVPKPLVYLGNRPILWHIMKYYAHFEHKHFILCLGYQAEKIKDYFLNYNEFLCNDFVLSNRGKKNLCRLDSDIQDWTITFADTGTHSNIGQRLKAVEKYVKGEDVFLANYSDNLTDFYLPDLIDHFCERRKTAAFLCVRPSLSCHRVCVSSEGLVQEIRAINKTDIQINGGYFVFRQSIFDHIKDGEELVQEPFYRLIAQKELVGYPYDGFWKSMDTFKEKQELDDLCTKGMAPWQLWKQPESAAAMHSTRIIAAT